MKSPWSLPSAASAAWAQALQPLHHFAEQRPLRRGSRHFGDLHEQYLCHRCMRAGQCDARACISKTTEEFAKRFGKLLGIDPWLINPMFTHCGEVDFAQGEGMDCLRTQVDALLAKVRRKYKEYGINEKPFVVVKADNGTYGMGITTVHDAKELENLGARAATKWR